MWARWRVEGVIQAIYDGTVDAVASDHSPHHNDEKELDFADAPFGIVGLETAVGLAIDRLVHGMLEMLKDIQDLKLSCCAPRSLAAVKVELSAS